MTPVKALMAGLAAFRIGLGVGYLASSGNARKLWVRLWLLVDTADTAMGAGMLSRGRLGPKVGALALATTAPAMALDVAALATSPEHHTD